MSRALVGFAILVTLAACDDGGDLELHVALDGDDAGPGTADQPFRSLTRARGEVRARAADVDGDIVVQIHAGTYVLDETLTLTAGDSGQNGHRVVYQARGTGTAAPDAVTLSGGRAITGWQLVDGLTDVWRADVGALDTRQLYVDGARAPRASLGASLPGTVTATDTGYQTDSPLPLSWTRPEDIELVYTGAYAFAEARCGVASITPGTAGTGAVITMDADCYRWARTVYTFDQDDPGVPRPFILPTAVENSASFLAPGAWHLDRTTAGAHALLYRASAGEDPRSLDIVAPALEMLVLAEGAAGDPVHDLAFRGLTFAHATWLGPDAPTGFVNLIGSFYCTACDGPDDDDWEAAVVPGAVTLVSTVRVAIEGNRFTHLGGQALWFADDTASARIVGNAIHDVSGGAIDLGATETIRIGNVIANNWIHDIGVEYRGSAAVSIAETEQATIAHNQIDHVPYSGIVSYTGQLGLRVLDNLIFDTNHVLPDGGGIYLHGAQGESVFEDGAFVRGNVIHAVTHEGIDPALGIPNAIYCDDGADLISLRDNVLYDNQSALGGVRPGRIVFRGNYWDDAEPVWYGPSVDVDARPEANTALATPGRSACEALPACAAILAEAGLEPEYRSLLMTQP